MSFTLQVYQRSWPLRTAFVTAQDNLMEIDTIAVSISDGHHTGHAEALGVDYHGENCASIRQDIEQIRTAVTNASCAESLRYQLLQWLPAGGARNALDCALWDLQAKQAGQRVWELLQTDVHSINTVLTLSIDTPTRMAEEALKLSAFPCLKLKLDAVQPVEQIAAVRAARPDAKLIADCNNAWQLADLEKFCSQLLPYELDMIEQPLAPGDDAELADFDSPILLCADESLQDLQQLEYVAQRYQAINIKLDKCGGLTAALELVEAAKNCGLELMVGNMLGSSLAMAPAFLVAQHCRWVDLDGPLLQSEDMQPAIRYDAALMHPPSSELWG